MGHGATGRPVKQFDRMDNRYVGETRDLGRATDIAGRDNVGTERIN